MIGLASPFKLNGDYGHLRVPVSDGHLGLDPFCPLKKKVTNNTPNNIGRREQMMMQEEEIKKMEKKLGMMQS